MDECMYVRMSVTCFISYNVLATDKEISCH